MNAQHHDTADQRYELLGRFIHDCLKSWRSDLPNDPAIADALSATDLSDPDKPPNRTTIGRWRSGQTKPTKDLDALVRVLDEGDHSEDVAAFDIKSAINYLSDTEENLKRWHHRQDAPKLALPYLKEKWPEPAASDPEAVEPPIEQSSEPPKELKAPKLLVLTGGLAIFIVAAAAWLFSMDSDPPSVAGQTEAEAEKSQPTQSVKIGGRADGASISQTIQSGD